MERFLKLLFMIVLAFIALTLLLDNLARHAIMLILLAITIGLIFAARAITKFYFS